MLKVSNNNIYLTRGDSASLNLSITLDKKTEYTLREGDQCLFSVKSNTDTRTTKYIFQKMVTPEKQIEINPEDTCKLEYGEYKYDVQLTTAEGSVHTIIEPHSFFITEEVTF